MKEWQPFPACFSFTEREQLYDQLSHDHLMALMMQPDIDVHEVVVSSNSFGEYLFITLSCRTEQSRTTLTFWGLGYHEYRERWMVDTWQWFESYRQPEKSPVIPKEAAYRQVKDREAFVRAQENSAQPSSTAQLYEWIADLTDEDGALAELDDLGWALLSDDDEEDT